MKQVDPKLLSHLLDLRPATPEGESGPIRIEHEVKPPGSRVVIVSMRNAILQGIRATETTFDAPFTIRHLTERHVGEWMTDSPQEVWQMATAYNAARGNVLCGGVGLGVLPHLLWHAPGVRANGGRVVAVDRSVDICNLVSPYINAACQVADIFYYLKHNCRPGRFDFAVFDTWQMTSESTWWMHVVPLRRLARGKIKQVMCWAEDEMHGQLRMSLPPKATMSDDIKIINEPKAVFAYQEVFRRACRAAGIRPTWGREDMGGNTDSFLMAHNAALADKRIANLLHTYLNLVGTDAWERKFGELWDSLVVPPPEEWTCPALSPTSASDETVEPESIG